MKKIYKFLFIAFATSGLLLGCEDLEVINENNPDFDRVLNSPVDVETVAGGLYNTIFYGEHSENGAKPMMAVLADNITCSYGNFDMRWAGNEPRDNSWNNAPTYGQQINNKWPYDQYYSAIGSAVDVLTAINQGMDIVIDGVDNTDRAKAMAKFALGMAYGNLALAYDRAHLVDDVITVEPVLETALPYTEIADAAIGYLEEALTLSNTAFTIPGEWLGRSADVSNTDFKKIINTCAARILAYLPRNNEDLLAVDWAKVKAYADAGITTSWIIVQDNNIWWFGANYYMTIPGWARTDMYVAHLMEPSLPAHWDNDAAFPHPPQPADPMDSRLTTDFQYMPSNDFPVARGYYHFSAYRFKRYDQYFIVGTGGIGPVPTMLAAENDLLKAEARAYLGDLAGAAAIINAGTRVTRGGLDPVAEDLEDIIQAIHHERHVELYTTGGGLQWYEMRKLDLLQKGSPLHFPIPGGTLQLLGLTSFYTFGTVANADGEGTSNGGWR